MTEATSKSGLIYTFYSYKGGVGRSMALANVAVLMCKMGHRVLIVDWDLEAPGLEIFFQKSGSLKNGREEVPGIVDLLEAQATGSQLDWQQCLLKASVFNRALDILSAGQKTDDYQKRVQNLDWVKLFESHRVGNYVNCLREEWKNAYDFILVDSRTGITDIGDICTVLLPDALVLLFVSNWQNVFGIRDLMQRATNAHKKLPVDRDRLVAVPIPARDEVYNEYDKSNQWKEIFAKELGDLYRAWLPRNVEPREALNKLFIPYVTNWSFGERLPVVENPREIDNPASISASYARIATLLINGLDWKALDRVADPHELESQRAEVVAAKAETESAKQAARAAKENAAKYRRRVRIVAILIAIGAVVSVVVPYFPVVYEKIATILTGKEVAELNQTPQSYENEPQKQQLK